MLSNTEDILEDLKKGKMVLIVDDESRENEGDFIMAASKVTPEDINFMSKYARGLICLTLTRERCKQINLPLMKNDTDSKHETNFTISIEASEGVTTGISAYDRAHTIRTAVMPDATANDISRPGHIFPLMAQPGGVLTRAGHTEAGCDLARLAGFEPAAVIVEIMSDDGSMARLPELTKIAEDHKIKIGTIEDLIKYRTKHEKTVIRKSESPINTEYGEFNLVSYEDILSNPKEELKKITKFLSKFIKLQTSENKEKNIINTTSFKSLKKMEEEGHFTENVFEKISNKKIKFFNQGPDNNWQNNLNTEIKIEIEKNLEVEMKELGYL